MNEKDIPLPSSLENNIVQWFYNPFGACRLWRLRMNYLDMMNPELPKEKIIYAAAQTAYRARDSKDTQIMIDCFKGITKIMHEFPNNQKDLLEDLGIIANAQEGKEALSDDLKAVKDGQKSSFIFAA